MADAHLKGKFDGIDASVVVSRDGHILDGHHRWAALLTIDPARKMKVKVIDMDMKDLLEEAQSVPGVYKADFEGSPLGEDDQKEYKSKAKSRFPKKEASLRAGLIRLAYSNPALRSHILPLLKQAGGRSITVEIEGFGSRPSVRVKDIEGTSPWGEAIGQVARLEVEKLGKTLVREALQFATANKRELEAMGSGDRVVEAINAHVYKATGKYPRWSYIQLPM